jgi:predicted alpha/beta hydrolase
VTVEEPLILTAADGFKLGATRYGAQGEKRGSIVIAGATAVPQGFYRRFADHAAGRGFTVLTFDYRGTGRSRPATLRGFRMDFRDWGTLDLAAMVDAMAAEGGPVHLIGHSYGGHALGLLPNHHRLASAYAFGVGAGWNGWMPPLERAKVWLLWHTLLPTFNAIMGYTPMSWLGLGEDLPSDATRAWRRWCGFPRYYFDDPDTPGMAELFAKVATPVAFANALDDLWALPRSREAFIWAYANAPVTRLDIDPAPYRGLGHMGYFRAKAQPLWDAALDWMAAR